MCVHPSSELRPVRRAPRVRSVLAALLLAALVAGPAAANIPAGVDLFVSQPGDSYQDFNPNPIPPGFFGPGSQPFDGIITFSGSPLGPLGPVDTIVQRMAFAPLSSCGDMATVPIELVALNLVSVNPIKVTYASSPPTQWNVQVTLSSVVMPQPQGTMTIQKTWANGGTFSSTLYVQPKLIFVNTANALDTRTLDTGGLQPPTILNSTGSWMDPAAAAGFAFVTSPGGILIDNDLNPITPSKVIAPTSPNFVAGMRGVGATCETPMAGYGKVLTEEEQAWARHGVLPAQEHFPQPDGREGSTCLPDGSCIITTPSMAALLGGNYHGDNTYCAGDANNDGKDDSCQSLPGLAPWGSAALALLLMGSGLWFVSRRRASSGPIG